MATGVITFCDVPASLSTFEKVPFEKIEGGVNGRGAYKVELPTSDGTRSFAVWFNAEKKIFVLGPSEDMDNPSKFACLAYCPAADAQDPTEVASQWVTAGTEKGEWKPQPEMVCAPAKIVESDK
mmetsp:Transcript_56509/g.104634  ORF Transcript_56509/g.104634 Transcript_56509/m.104634 type:complete len:124 (+) Transcript_56509:74-445(+)